MTEQENLTQAYDAATAEIFEALDAVHIALVNLQNVKRQIAGRVADLGMVGIAGKDGAGKNLAKAVEAAALLNVENVGSIHGHIMTARTLLIGSSPNLVTLGEAGLVVYDWQSEFNGIIPVER